jgi:hypothetical protein
MRIRKTAREMLLTRSYATFSSFILAANRYADILEPQVVEGKNHFGRIGCESEAGKGFEI